MKKKFFRRIISAVLVVAMSVYFWPAAAYAQIANDGITTEASNVTDISNAQLKDLISGLSDLKANEKKILSRNELSPFVDYETAYAKGHVERLYNMETLNSIVYLNKNNSKTVYYYDDNIKYVDQDGKILEKDITLKVTSNGYTTKQNDISILLPNVVSNGIDVAYKGKTLKLIPLPVSNSSNLVVRSYGQFENDGNAVKYSSVFGNNSDIIYTPTLNGVKEEIVLTSYNGVNSWSFLVQTNGMYAYCGDDGIYYFAESKNADEKFSLGQVFVYDSASNIDGGTMQITEIKSGETYKVTMTVDAQFLENTNTVYPVYVDPQVEITNAETTSNILDTTIYSVKNTTNTGTWALNHAGLYSTAYGVGRILVKLPGLTSSTEYLQASADDITNVTFYICEASGKGGQSFSIHAFTGANWTETGATWNNVNADSYVSEAVATATPASRAYGAFDITSLVKAWKNGTQNADYGFILKNTNETNGAQCRAFIGNNHATTTQRPKLSITYCESLASVVSGNLGVNDTYTYDTATLDSNITSYTSHAYGSFVSVNSFDIKVKDFPIAPEYVYNSTLYSNTASGGDFYNYYGISTNYKMGKGWKLSLIELVRYNSSENVYKYVDTLGTEYLFEYDSTKSVYTNSALGATLSVDSDSGAISIEYNGITRTFNSSGLVSSVVYNDKTYTYNYTGTYALSSVTCSGNTILSITYTSNKLTGIGDYTITYDSSLNVTGITDSYANIYAYQTASSVFAVRRVIDGYAYVYNFDSTQKVSQIKYCRYINSAYNIIEEKRPTYSTRYTVYCDPGADFNFSTTDDNIYTTIVFSQDKRTMYSVVREKDGNKIHDALMYSLPENEGGNKTASSVAGGGKENFLDNSSFETTTGVTGLTQSIEEKLLGSYSAKLSSAGTISFSAPLSAGQYTFSAYVKLKNVALTSNNTSGGAFVEVCNASNAVVASSEYYVGTSLESIGGGWYRIFVTFNVTSAQTYKLKIVLKDATGTVYADCAQLEASSVPTEYSAIPFGGAESAAGTNPWSSTTDAVSTTSQASDGTHSWQLAAGKTVYRDIPVNVPVTASFIISGWSKTTSVVSTGYGMDVTLKYSDNTEETVQLRFDGSNPGWQYQCYEVTSSKDDTSLKITSIRVSLVNETTVPSYYEDVFMSMAFDSSLSDADESDSETSDETVYSTGLSFKSNGDGTCFIGERKDCTDTVIVIPPVSPDGDTVTQIGNSAFKNYTDITEIVLPDTIKGISENAFGGCSSLKKINIPDGVTEISKWAFVSCSSLTDITIPDGVTSIGYKSFSYCSSLKALNIPKTVTSFGDYAFNGTSGLTLYYEGTSAEYAAITKGTGAVPSGVSVAYNSYIHDGIAYIYTYDENDNVTSTTMKYVGSDSTLVNGTDVIYTSSTYDADGNCLTYTDEAGNTTTYTYDSHGNVLTVTDANNITTTYTYNSNGLVATMSRETATNTYTYTNGLLTKIVHSDTSTDKSETYNITYNVYGNITSIAVGTQTLIGYEYANNGAAQLIKTTYGNGNYETYTYDVWGNVIKQYFGTTLKYEYAYDPYGSVITAIDYESGRTKKLIYGANDEFVGTAVIENANKNVLMLANGVNYIFADGDTSNFTAEYDYTYDAIGRKKSHKLNVDGQTLITRTFGYNGAANANDTNQIVYEKFSTGETFYYDYDELNRLTNVYEDGMIVLSYEYDEMGRLTRENNAYTHKTYVYEYTANGNISARKTYPYTTGVPETEIETITYLYSELNWKDQLIGITVPNDTTDIPDDTVTITINYDGMGNPTKWHNASELTWEGRKLKSFKKTDDTVITYTYDENGIRTGKQIGNEKVEYILDGTKIIREIRDDYTLTFLYDDGTLVGFNYDNGTSNADYYYGIDIWGNINYIYNSTGTVVVKYEYDAWGNPISTTGTLKDTIGAINPYRYKSYYYDSEINMYYLQSRYYDASVQRFISADKAEYLDTSSEIYTNNLYLYCLNDPVNKSDKFGNLPFELVGFGFQIEISRWNCSLGMEIVWYFSSSIRGGRAWYIPYVYFYGGWGLSGDTTNLISNLTKDPSLLFNPKGLLKASGSICVFAIFGYTGKFNKPEDYEEWFTNYYAIMFNRKAYTALGSSCFSVGVGFSTNKFEVGSGKSYYVLSYNILAKINQLYEKIKAIAISIKP